MGATPTIKADLKHNWIVVLILCVGMFSNWLDGYCMYALALLIPFVFTERMKWPGFILIVYSVLFMLFAMLGGQIYTPSSMVFDLIFPITMWQVGQRIVRRTKNPQSDIIVLLLMIFSLALPAIVFNIAQAIDTGEVINVTRAIRNDDGDILRSATGFGMMLSLMLGCSGVLLLQATTKTDTRIKIFLIIGAIAAIFSTIHLVNRTGLVLVGLSLFVAIILRPLTFKRACYIVLVIVAVGSICYFVLGDTYFMDAMEYYEGREKEEGYGSESYGGRTDRWAAAVTQLAEQPFGNANGLNFFGKYTYAHNMWLDVGLKGGIFAMAMLILFSIVTIQQTIKFFRNRNLSLFERNLMVLVCLTMFLQAFVEPVKDGVPQFLWFMMFYTSVLFGINHKCPKSIAKQ